MNTEHIIQIGINVDDEAIRKATIEQAAKSIAEAVNNEIYEKDYYGRVNTKKPELIKKLIDGKLDEVIEANKDVIIENVVEKLVEKISRSKAYKEKITAIL